jgi:iron complex outermembrane recepter protein
MRNAICLLAAAVLVPMSTWAADETPVVEELVVTAQKREERLRDVPMSIAAFGDEMLAAAGVQTVGDLPAVAPGVTGSTTSSSQPLLAIRGVSSNDFGIGGDPALGIHVDEVYAGRSAGAIRDIIDLQRIEVLKGPQGTLFGRNTTAGAINFVTPQPTAQPEARVRVFAGNRSAMGASAILNGGISESVAMRGSLSYRESDGDRRNAVDGRDYEGIEHLAARWATRWQSQDGSDWILTFDGERDRDDGPTYKSLSLPFPTDPAGGTKRGDVYNDLGAGSRSDRDLWGVTLRGEVPLSFATLTSITAMRSYEIDYAEDTDGTFLRQLHFFLEEESDSYMQELRLGGETGRLTWFAGASVLLEEPTAQTRANYDEDAICTGLAGLPMPLTCDLVLGGGGTIVGMTNQFESSRAQGDYRAYALFSDLKWALTDATNVTFGWRVTRDEKQIDITTPLTANLITFVNGDNIFLSAGAQSMKESWTEPTARLVLDHRLAGDQLAYASLSRGYKSGGFNALQATGAPFDPEFVDAFELGLKGTIGTAVGFDVAAYAYEYKDLQVQVFEGGLPVVRNAAQATGYGLDLNASMRLTSSWTLDTFGTWLVAEYDDFTPRPGVSYRGNRLNRAPEFTVGAALSLDTPITPTVQLLGRIGYLYQGEVFFTPDNSEAMSQEDLGLLDARLGVRLAQERFEIAVFGDNLTDEDYVTHGQAISTINLLQVHPGHRRTFGVELIGRW